MSKDIKLWGLDKDGLVMKDIDVSEETMKEKMSNQKQTKNWEEEFAEKFGEPTSLFAPEEINSVGKKIKSFIRQTVKQELAKFADAVRLEEKMAYFDKPRVYASERGQVLSNINQTAEGYNRAVQELNQKIEEYLGKK